jgi:hypothetical protein
MATMELGAAPPCQETEERERKNGGEPKRNMYSTDEWVPRVKDKERCTSHVRAVLHQYYIESGCYLSVGS